MKVSQISKFTVFAALFSLAACAPAGDKAGCTDCGTTPVTAAGGGTNSPSNSNGGGNLPNIDLEGNLSGGTFANSRVVNLDMKLQELVLTLPLPIGSITFSGASATVPFPKVPGARITMGTQNGRPAVELRVPLKKLVKGVEDLDPAKLPNGDPLPAVAGGEMPSTAVSINTSKKQSVALYMQKTMVGLFVSTSFDISGGTGIQLTLPILDKQKRVLGYVTNIAKKGTYLPGVFMVFQLPADIARSLDNYF